ncbi:MAG: ribulose-phosphate 3-epimerase [Bacteroidales bacterium]|nr:ribulose-phosphate 3-epimerase [Bacteroidales bacterium]MDD3201493.1 ribulose-phosphate 3-epimerase [Bacteroidales bacterium]
MERIIAPSMLSADFGHLSDDCRMINESAADWFHLDIMDGVFVPNISYGFPVLKAIAKVAQKPMDAHLMIVDPDRYIEQFAASGVEYLSVHYEACTHLHRTVQNIHACGMKAGVAINPHTSVMLLDNIVNDLDYVVVMSVNPGFGGQSFINGTYRKIQQLSELISECQADCIIEVDGGVNYGNIAALSQAGARIFVTGHSVFSAESPKNEIERLKKG